MGRMRLQFLSVGVVLLLVMIGCSARLLELKPGQLTDTVSHRALVALHERGDAVRQQRQTAVLADHTAIPNYPDCSKAACIALTFDDGPNPLTTPQIVATLESEHVPATFFVIGNRVPGNEALLQRMQAAGSEIGNHSWSHPDLTKLPPDQVKQQIESTQAVIMAAGVPAPTLFRPPYEAVNPMVQQAVKPLTLALWNEDPKDWAAETSAQVLAASEAAAKPGGVIDMHDIYHVTADALKPLIDYLKDRHFRFVTMSQLMGSHDHGDEYYGGYKP